MIAPHSPLKESGITPVAEQEGLEFVGNSRSRVCLDAPCLRTTINCFVGTGLVPVRRECMLL